MISASSVQPSTRPQAAVATAQEPSSAPGPSADGADFLAQLQAALDGAAAVPVEAGGTPAVAPTDPESAELDAQALQNLPTEALLQGVVTAIFAAPVAVDSSSEGGSPTQAGLVAAALPVTPPSGAAVAASAAAQTAEAAAADLAARTPLPEPTAGPAAAAGAPAAAPLDGSEILAPSIPMPAAADAEVDAVTATARAAADPGAEAISAARAAALAPADEAITSAQAVAVRQALDSRLSTPTDASLSAAADPAPQALRLQADASTPVASDATDAAAAADEAAAPALLPSGSNASQAASAAGQDAVAAQPQIATAPVGANTGPTAGAELETAQRMPLEPHLMRLDSGPVQVEVLKLVREGGGQILLELTPPDQGTYRLELRLDAQGRAHLVVEGASDSVRTRLEQGEAGLRDQLSQMGLSLNLDYRQPDRHHAADRPDEQSGGLAGAGDPAQAGSGTGALTDAPRQRIERGLVHLYA